MHSEFLDTSFLNSHPRLQRTIDLLTRLFVSGINAIFLAVLGVIVSIAIYYDNIPFVILVLSIYFLVILISIIYIFHLIIKYVSPYRVKIYNLAWKIVDELGNVGSFTLEEEIVLNQMTDTISLFFPLDVFVQNVIPYNTFQAKYLGYRKEIIAIMTANRQAGDKFRITAQGKRNVTRLKGNNVIEIPIEFHIDELNISVTLQNQTNCQLEPKVLIRHGAELLPIDKKSNVNINARHQGHTFHINCQIKKPRYGHSYFLIWDRHL